MWLSPTGFNDPSGKWGYETDAYDNNTSTGAYTNVVGSYIELTHASLSCDKIQIYISTGPWGSAPIFQSDPNIDIDLYYDSAWHNIFSGIVSKLTWVEKTNPAGTKTVTTAGIKFNSIDAWGRLWEFDFWEVEGPEKVTQYLAGNDLPEFPHEMDLQSNKLPCPPG